MNSFELSKSDISNLNDSDLRELIGRLCEAELLSKGFPISEVHWGGAQEAADDGVDVSVEIKPEMKSLLQSDGFIPASKTIFQVKKHAMGKAACKKEMLDKNGVKQSICNLSSKNGAYIIVSGKDDCSQKMLDQRLNGMKETVSSLDNKDKIILHFYGRDRIASWLRQHSSVSLWARSKLGKNLSGWKPYGRWTATKENIADDLLTDEHPCVFPSNVHPEGGLTLSKGLNFVKEKLHSGEKTIRIVGLSGVGKTRFVQALFEKKSFENTMNTDPLPRTKAIYADIGEEITPTALEVTRNLITNPEEAYLILDNCSPGLHRQLQKEITASNSTLRLLTVEYDISDDEPEETVVIRLEPISVDLISKLIQRRYPELEFINANRIAEFSGGNARVAIALANGVGPSETLTNFSDEQLFDRLFNQRKDQNAALRKSAEILSLVYSFNTEATSNNPYMIESNKDVDELSTLGNIADIKANVLYEHIAELVRRQLAQKRGPWRAILPHALSNKLARYALENLRHSKINAELFKPENYRLFKSCAHRIGYLHDCEEARDLAESWIKPDAPLNDIVGLTKPCQLSREHFTCLQYIAPTIPDKILSLFEEAINQPNFASREKMYGSDREIVCLLCQIGYDSDKFERAMMLALNLAEAEDPEEKYDSIVTQMEELFALYPNKTKASPAQRQNFVKKLLTSSNPRHILIASKLISAAFYNGSSCFAYSTFGARKRNSGWRSSNSNEYFSWYKGFIDVLENALKSENPIHVSTAQKIFKNNFSNLWFSVKPGNKNLHDILETIVEKYTKNDNWPSLWVTINSILEFHDDKQEEISFKRLKKLGEKIAPDNPYSEMQTYVFSNIWKHAETRSSGFMGPKNIIIQKIIALGQLAASNITYIERLGDRLWCENFNGISNFGQGLAQDNPNQLKFFDYLLHSVNACSIEDINPQLFCGFIEQVHAETPSLVRQMQERLLKEPKFKAHSVQLLCRIPLQPWGVQRLIELADKADEKGLHASAFTLISMGRIHEAILDDDLALLLENIIHLPNGCSAAIDILQMRFYIEDTSPYSPNNRILSVGRKVIKSLLKEPKGQIWQVGDYNRTIRFCFNETTPRSEIEETLTILLDSGNVHGKFSHEFHPVIVVLVEKFPELLLDKIFEQNENGRFFQTLKICSSQISKASLHLIPIERLIAWCNGEETKIQHIAQILCPYTTEEKLEISENPKEVKLSEHIMAILEIAEDKKKIVETIFEQTYVSSWSGYLSYILEIRSKALEKLTEHPSLDVREIAKEKLQNIKQSIQRQKEIEKTQDKKDEQRFE